MKAGKFKLPPAGLPTCYYDFPKDDADKVVKGVLRQKDYAAAYRASSLLLNFDARRNALAAFPIYERLVLGVQAHGIRRGMV